MVKLAEVCFSSLSVLLLCVLLQVVDILSVVHTTIWTTNMHTRPLFCVTVLRFHIYQVAEYFLFLGTYCIASVWPASFKFNIVSSVQLHHQML